jgi:hypothetical protein
MSNIDVSNYLDQLKRALPCVQPISPEPLKALHAAQDYKGMVQLIKKAMNIADVTFLVFWVADGAAQKNQDKNAPAWIQLPRLPDRLPFYGTKEFKETSLKIFFRKSFLRRQTYDQVAITIAHELSHVVLDSIRHPLFREEKAVDLTAMLLGFRRLYLSGAHTEKGRIGYLSLAEVHLANKLIEASYSGSKTPSSTFGYVRLKATLPRANLTSGLIVACILFMIAIWLRANDLRTSITKSTSGMQSNSLQQGNSTRMKATLPQDLLDRLDK